MPLRSGLFLPVLDEFADPTVVAGLSVGRGGRLHDRPRAEIGWDQSGRFPYDRKHAEL
jgi:hypothetical protein